MFRPVIVGLLLLGTLVAGCFGDKDKDDASAASTTDAVTPLFQTTAATTLAPTSDPCRASAAPTLRVNPPAAADAAAPAVAAAPDLPGSLLNVPAAARDDAPTEATIKTDAYGVSHIYADDAYTLFYANGYVQARDRLFQMDVLRHVGYGDSAAIVGASQLASDMQVRRDLYSRDEIVQQYLDADPTLQEAGRAYADGVNRFMVEAIARNALPSEFLAVGHVPEPWTVFDTVASINYLIGYFGVGGGEELANAQKLSALATSLGSTDAAHAAFADLSWLQVKDSYTSIPAKDKQVLGCESVPRLSDLPAEQITMALAAKGAVAFGIPAELPIPIPPSLALGQREGLGLFDQFHWGSNAFLIDGSKTATGQPMMFGGPQMGYYKPPVPYQIGLHGAGYDTVGIGVTSAPGIVIGRTPTFAWSVTSGADDQVDTVAVNLDPADDRRYLWDGVSQPMECRTEVHRSLPNAADTSLPQVLLQEVCRIQGMPVVSWNPDADIAWAQKTTTRGKELEGAWMWLSLARQKDLAGFMGQLGTFPFTFNYNYAGPEGIAYIHTGDIPLRDAGIDPRFPALSGSAHAWRGEAIGLGLQTYIVNPSTGYVVNWNNAPAKGWRTGDQLMNWGSTHRVQLLDHFVQERMKDPAPWTWQDVADTLQKAATHDPFARATAPAMIDAARKSGDADLAPLADALDEWRASDYAWADADGDDMYDHTGHTIFDEARIALQDKVLRDELGDTTPELIWDPTKSSDPHAADHGRHDNKESTVIDALNGRTSHPWCDDVSTSDTETCDTILVASLEEARANLTAAYGADPAGWRMVQHHSKFKSIGGGFPDEIPMVNRGSWNQVVAIGQGLDQAQGVLPPANSGLINPLELVLSQAGLDAQPPRITAELELYKNFQYKPLPVTPEEVDSVAATTETLP